VSIDLSNQIRSTLKTFGLMAGKGMELSFETWVQPLLAAWRAVRPQIGILDRRLITLAKGGATCRLLMTCPGVGVIVATSYAAAIEAPAHFWHSRSVGAYLGLTPVRHQSGQVDRTPGISRRGDRLMRPAVTVRAKAERDADVAAELARLHDSPEAMAAIRARLRGN
jgi:transposase